MSDVNFLNLFGEAFQHRAYAYQCRLACGPDADPTRSETLKRGTSCQSQLIDIPTGLGKTAAVVLAWLWNRVLQPSVEARKAWPRRLVFCLPMRTLVEQTRENVEKWLKNISDKADELGLDASAKAQLEWLKENSPVVLMGGEEAKEWDIYPEKDAILIGTQDMLLSRALNRGYGSARARWPMHFGLLNNDCLWVLDETQLMGVGVRTSAQLEGLRSRLGTAAPCFTWWASATLDSRLLLTPDHSALPTALGLSEEDYRDAKVISRVKAVKRLAALPLTLPSDSGKIVDPYLQRLAEVVIEKHQANTTTIVIVNRVDRAQGLFEALEKKAKSPSFPRCILVHSRFRPMERETLSQQIKEPGEKIIIATQAIEAGVDISSRTLISELAPWSSLVQRFGRCNRAGEFNEAGGADIFWINLEAEDAKNSESLALPYTPAQLNTARTLLREAEDAGACPAALAKLHIAEPLEEVHILRRKDLVDLFDTTPDLANFDIDVGRYIRDGEERDVQVYWRDVAPDGPPADGIVARREELVRVPLHAFKKFVVKNKAGIWFWDVLDGAWLPLRPDQIGVGRVYLIIPALGGYSVALGWTGEKEKEPIPLFAPVADLELRAPRDGQDLDDESQWGRNVWQSIETHTAHVVEACREKLQALSAAERWSDVLLTAARWHDVGKAHECFQTFIVGQQSVPGDLKNVFIAKSPWKPGSRHSRPHFRHELASTLAWLQVGQCDDPELHSLVAYLIATHHGKIRLSLRAMPGEIAPESLSDEAPPLFARGVWQGDRLPPVGERKLTIEGFPQKGISLDLTCMQMGEQNGKPSWTARTLALRDGSSLGLFRLAWLETLLRAADAQGSQR